ncbi:MAG: Hsp20 family protein [Alphaproteobacteria bacterium]|nr:Hsp20 family protein [Alphaproteobacteria bacterium]
MRTFDLNPLLRSSIGFDRVNRVLEAATRLDDSAFTYPPYNIEKVGDNEYRLTMAVAGFAEDDLDLTVKESTLIIRGKAKADSENAQYMHRGIGRRAFERRFDLADHIEVRGASLVNGLLNVDMVREIPEAMKPRTIAIETKAGNDVKTVEAKAA